MMLCNGKIQLINKLQKYFSFKMRQNLILKNKQKFSQWEKRLFQLFSCKVINKKYYSQLNSEVQSYVC